MNTFYEFKTEIINKLKNNGLIKRFSSTEVKQILDIQLIIKLFKNPVEIYTDDYGLDFIDEDGDKNYYPEMFLTISEKCEWFSYKVPNVDFDIDQSGNVLKSEIIGVAKNYDFDAQKSIFDDLMSG